VAVPSGDRAVSTPLRPGSIALSSRKSSSPGVNSSSSGIRLTVKLAPIVNDASEQVSGAV